jgi:hypothetical protein
MNGLALQLIGLWLLLAAFACQAQPPIPAAALTGEATAETYAAKFTWPATGETNRVMLDGVQVAWAITNCTITNVAVGRRCVSVISASGRTYHSLVFSREIVSRWTGRTVFATNALGPYEPVTLRAGQALTGPSGFFAGVIERQPEIVTWWRWADREGLNLY